MEARISEKIPLILIAILFASCVQVCQGDHVEEDNSTLTGPTGDKESQIKADLDDILNLSNLDKRSSLYESYPQPPASYEGQGSPNYQREEKPYGNNYKKAEGYSKYSKEAQSRKEVKAEVYDAVTYHNLNESYHCGVIPDTNFELYQSHPSGYGSKGVYDIAPFGKFPWTVLITYKNNYVCTGVLIQSQHVLTSASCIPEYRSLSKYRARIGDWDLLTNYNEYEAYQNLEYRICGRYPVDKKDYSGDQYGQQQYSYGANGYFSSPDDLVVLRISDRVDHDLGPHVKPICLPSNYYEEPAYNNNYKGQSQGQGYSSAKGYGYGQPGQDYSSYKTGNSKDYSKKTETHCWVVGWYGSKKTPLDNHSQPSKVDSGYENQYSMKYSQKYYPRYDKSFVQKRAKVKEIQCHDQRSYSTPYTPYNSKDNEGYSSASNSVCFVGVEGYDACVADRGSAIFCVIPEKTYYNTRGGSGNNYESGYTKPKDYYKGSSHDNVDNYYQLYKSLEEDEAEVVFPQKYAKAGSYGKTPYQKDIKAHPTQLKSPRYRAVLYAIVQKPTKCSKKSLYSEAYYFNNYKQQQQSNPIRATKVDYKVIRSIISTFWESAEDETCPAPLANYRGPKSRRRYNSYSSKRRPNYNPYL